MEEEEAIKIGKSTFEHNPWENDVFLDMAGLGGHFLIIKHFLLRFRPLYEII